MNAFGGETDRYRSFCSGFTHWQKVNLVSPDEMFRRKNMCVGGGQLQYPFCELHQASAQYLFCADFTAWTESPKGEQHFGREHGREKLFTFGNDFCQMFIPQVFFFFFFFFKHKQSRKQYTAVTWTCFHFFRCCRQELQCTVQVCTF